MKIIELKVKSELYGITDCIINKERFVLGFKTFPCGSGEDHTLTGEQYKTCLNEFFPGLKERIQFALNIPENHFDNHKTDLYIMFSESVNNWLKDNYEYYNNITRFISRIDGNIWLEIPFAYNNNNRG